MIASLITIENQKMIIVLKTTYDEKLAKYSPGRLIDYYMLKNTLTADNAKNIENYTNASIQDQRWFPRVRQMYHVTIYRNALMKILVLCKRKLTDQSSD